MSCGYHVATPYLMGYKLSRQICKSFKNETFYTKNRSQEFVQPVENVTQEDPGRMVSNGLKPY